jgi:fructoselysine-6-phosphate deglycase
MLNFEEQRFIRIQSGALAQAEGIHAAITDCLERGAENLFFAGSGGAGILMWPAARLLQTRSAFPVHVEMPAELVVSGSVHLGPRSIVVIPSLSGTTPESVAALEYCRERGATVIALVGHGDTPLATGADHAFVNFAEDDTSCESFYLQSLLLALAVMQGRGESEAYAAICEELVALPELLVAVKEWFEPRAEVLAKTIAADGFHILTGAGHTWPQAFYYGMCILEEMQWIKTRPVHASDFFHGTLELLQPGVSLLILKGEGPSRALAERVEKFALQYTDKVEVLDAAECPLPGVSQPTRELLSSVLLATVLERVSAHLEVIRDHPLTTRRYYKRVAY